MPGLAGGYELMGPLARILSQRFRVIGYQLRGEDDCFALRRSFGLQDLAADLAEFIESQGLESPAVLGVSFGTVAASRIWLRKPHSWSALPRIATAGRLSWL